MPSCAINDNNSNSNELQADESLIARETKIKSELIETLNKAYSLGKAWLGRMEDWGYWNLIGGFLDGSDNQIAEYSSSLRLSWPEIFFTQYQNFLVPRLWVLKGQG